MNKLTYICTALCALLLPAASRAALGIPYYVSRGPAFLPNLPSLSSSDDHIDYEYIFVGSPALDQVTEGNHLSLTAKTYVDIFYHEKDGSSFEYTTNHYFDDDHFARSGCPPGQLPADTVIDLWCDWNSCSPDWQSSYEIQYTGSSISKSEWVNISSSSSNQGTVSVVTNGPTTLSFAGGTLTVGSSDMAAADNFCPPPTIYSFGHGVLYDLKVTISSTNSSITIPAMPSKVTVGYHRSGTLALCCGSFPNGFGSTFQFKVTGPASDSVTIEASDDLATWSNIGTITTDGFGTWVTFQDTSASSYTHRFYLAQDASGCSVNSLGFTKISLVPGYTMLANQLSSFDDTVGTAMPSVPEGTDLYQWDVESQGWTAPNTFSSGQWSDPIMTVDPGDGILAYNPSSTTATIAFVGDVLQQTVTNQVPTGESFKAYVFPVGGRLDTTLGFPVTDGDTVYHLKADGTWDSWTYEFGSWSGGPTSYPSMAIGESFIVAVPNAVPWTSSLNISCPSGNTSQPTQP